MKMTGQQTRILKALGIFLLCLITFGFGFWLNGYIQSPDAKLLSSAFRYISNDSLFNQQSKRELTYAAIRGMLAIIDDPYAELIEPDATINFNNTFAGQTGVVGLYAENQGGKVVITIVYPGGSADEAGLKVGDVILAIDGSTLDSAADSSETGLMIRGLPGTKVHLKIQRDNQVLEYDLLRHEQVFVTSRMLSDGIGYIYISAFNRTSSQQMKKALEELMSQNPKGLVWDLRNNEGGDMLAAQEIISYFIEDGLLFTAQLTQNRTVQFQAKGKAIAPDIPLVVLIDKTTYSAAEASAAAVAETGRGTTIGSASYGKGVIQATVSLVDNHMLQMTIARWLSPKGEWYHERGVPPQIEASDDPNTETDELLEKAVSIFSENK